LCLISDGESISFFSSKLATPLYQTQGSLGFLIFQEHQNRQKEGKGYQFINIKRRGDHFIFVCFFSYGKHSFVLFRA